MINWKVRIKNKMFWIGIIPAVALTIQAIANVFGFHLDLTDTVNNLIDVVTAVFGVLVLLGVVIDPTTKGVGDSDNALTYEEPK